MPLSEVALEPVEVMWEESIYSQAHAFRGVQPARPFQARACAIPESMWRSSPLAYGA